MHAERAGWAMVIGLGLALAGCQTERPPAPVIAPPPSCHDIDFSIYFEPGSAGITREAAQLISSARDRAQGCRVTGIVVVGLADAKGARGANLELSKARADSVSRFLAASGFSNVEFREGAAGAAGAATPAGAQKPLRRRADVAIHLAPPS
jgi:outer membrane protein OmpA-like peptidoglycan-associated protein